MFVCGKKIGKDLWENDLLIDIYFKIGYIRLYCII